MTQQRRLSIVLALNVLMITGLIVVGLLSHSISVLAAGGDFIADSLALVLGLVAIHMRDHHNQRQAPTYVALVNGLLLLCITGYVSYEAVSRLLTGNPEVSGLPILLVSAVSAAIMALGVFVLGKGAGNEDLHMRSVLLDTVSDGLAALSVAVVGAVIYFSRGLYWLDSVAAMAIGILIAAGAIRLLIDVARSLRSGAPLVLQEKD
jgi:cobalt-zinc-cadmium efflux system protein